MGEGAAVYWLARNKMSRRAAGRGWGAVLTTLGFLLTALMFFHIDPFVHRAPSPQARLAEGRVIANCPNYVSSGKGKALEMDVVVRSGELAFIDAWSFDQWSGGVFVTVTGPYSGHHVIADGALCSGIPSNANYQPVEAQRLAQLQASYQTIALP
jgi:hypothetical protein